MDEWIKLKISDIGEVVGGATPLTKNLDNYDGGTIPWITPKDLANHNERYISHGERNITEKGFKSASVKLLPKNSILFSSRAPIGYTAIAENDLTTNQGFKSIIPNNKIDYMFLFYLLKFNSKNIENMGSGTTFKEVSGSVMKNIQIMIPKSKILQLKISKILSDIDEKIELNNKINDNLENEAFELYKEYVNKTQKCSNIKILEDYCDIFTGKKNSNCAVKNGKYKFFTCAPNSQLIDSYIYDGNAIIISGNGAYTGRTRFYNGKFDLYQRTYACVIKNGKFEDYVYPLYWFVKFELSKSIMGGTRGSAIPYIVMNDISKFEFKFDERLFLSYLPMFKQCLLKIMDIEKEKDILVELRETLLPKLMSGKIDVSNIDI